MTLRTLSKYNMGWLSSVLTLMQQSAIGFSTYFIIQIVENVDDMTVSMLMNALLIFFALLSCAYLSGSGANMALLQVEYNHWGAHCKAVYGKLASGLIGADESQFNEIHSILSTESRDVICEFIHLQKNLLNTILSVFINSIAIMGAIGFTAGLIFTGAIVFGIFTFLLTRRKLRINAIKLRQSRIALIAYMAIIPARINLFPRKNFGKDIGKFLSLLKTYKSKDIIYLFLASTPPIVMIFSLVSIILVYQSNLIELTKAQMIGLIVSAPRIVQILQYSSDFLNSFSSFYNLIDRIKALQDTESMTEAMETEARKRFRRRIAIDKIIIDGHVFHDVDKALSHVLDKPRGRMLITGENGAGKSSFLKLLKMRGDNAVLLGPENMVGLSEFSALSTGQRLYSALKSLSEDDGIEIFLLDEWRANLDKERLAILHSQLEEIAEHKPVVEVVHHDARKGAGI
ncbi:MAG: hypothetical protein V6Z86_07540 [Hyphomicrobiales bacterium]